MDMRGKRLVVIGNTGHLFPSDLCWMRNDAGEDIVTIALKRPAVPRSTLPP